LIVLVFGPERNRTHPHCVNADTPMEGCGVPI
jgi:hypothetical protein